MKVKFGDKSRVEGSGVAGGSCVPSHVYKAQLTESVRKVGIVRHPGFSLQGKKMNDACSPSWTLSNKPGDLLLVCEGSLPLDPLKS